MLIKGLNLIKKLLICVLFLGGLAVCVFGLMNIAKAAAYKKYPISNGFVIDSALAKSPESQDQKELFILNIVYDYTVNNEKYYATVISSFGYNLFKEAKAYYTGSLEDMNKVLDKYPVGSSVIVYYNPENPQDCVIDADLKMPVFLPLILGAILILISAHLYIFSDVFSRLRIH